jgi:indole-3-acetate monooxygenase
VRTGDGAERQLERVTVKSTWHVSGMRATGSNDVTVNDLFVPEELSVRFGVQPRIDRPLYRHGYVLSLAGQGAARSSLASPRPPSMRWPGWPG